MDSVFKQVLLVERGDSGLEISPLTTVTALLIFV